MTVTLKEPQQVQAWRVSFSERPRLLEPPLIREPRAVWVDVDERGLREAMLDAAAEDGNLTIVFLPAGAGTTRNTQKLVDNWLASPPGDRSLEVHLAGGRFILRADRAVCFGVPPSSLDDAMVGIIRFTFCERELSRLESRVHESWEPVQT
ncbi:MAG: hypothetical protein ACRD9W_21710, partial [Terriglobia bacterium]